MQYFISNQTTFEASKFKSCSIKFILDHFKDKKFIQLDSETTGFDPHTNDFLTLQLGSTEHQFVIDATTVNLLPFKRLLEDKSKIILIHNAKFDLKWLYKKNIIPFNNVYDTFLAERIISTGIDLHKKSLAACIKRYCNVELPKEVRALIPRLGVYNTRVIEYAANDVKYLEDIYYAQQKIIKKENLERAISLDNLFVCVLAYTEYFGFKLDKQLWSEKAKEDKNKLYKIKDELDNLVVDYCQQQNTTKYLKQPDLFCKQYTCGINWNSQQQVIPLFKELGLDLSTVDKKTGTLKDSVESKIVTPQKDKHIIVAKYLKYQKAAKLVSTYGFEFLNHVNPVTGRIHSNFTQIMNTGRLSSGGSGTVNMQNIPTGKERSCFTVEKGNIFVVADYSSQESRILAEFSKDKRLVDFYLNGGADLHSYAVSLVYPELCKGLTLKEIKEKLPEKRQLMKGFNFALAYGGTAITVSQNLGIPLDVALEAEEKYFKAFPELKKYFERVEKRTLAQGHVLINNITGRKSYFYNLEEYRGTKNRLESYSNSVDSESSFQGLSNEFWSLYRIHKQSQSSLFGEIKALLAKYFRLRGIFGRKGLNYPIQGTAADMTKLAGVKFYKWLLDNNLWGKVFICAFVHDEIVTESPKKIADKVSNKLKWAMESAGKVFCPAIPIIAEPNIGMKWDH